MRCGVLWHRHRLLARLWRLRLGISALMAWPQNRGLGNRADVLLSRLQAIVSAENRKTQQLSLKEGAA